LRQSWRGLGRFADRLAWVARIGLLLVTVLIRQASTLTRDRTRAHVGVEQCGQLLRLDCVHAEDHPWPPTWLLWRIADVTGHWLGKWSAKTMPCAPALPS
jgi:hypothetical protein